MSYLAGYLRDFYQKAQERNDEPRLRLCRLMGGEAFALRETDPARALAMYDEGSRLAAALGEPVWVFVFDERRLTAQMHFLRDYRCALDLAVKSVLEIRKDKYDGLDDLQHDFHFHLIDAYVGIDPRGYAKEVREALAHLDAELSPEDESRYQLLASWWDFALALDDLDGAEKHALAAVARGEADPNKRKLIHWGTFAHDCLCAVSWRRADWRGLAERGAAGEELARKVGHKLELAGLQLWQALAVLHAGDAANARRLYRQSIAGVSRLRMPPEPKYFDALCGFLGTEGNIEGQWGVRERELATLRDKGRIDAESQCRLKRCRLLARLGRPMDEEMAAAREVANKLRDPAARMAELDAIARDGV
jgi:hypothetical protein